MKAYEAPGSELRLRNSTRGFRVEDKAIAAVKLHQETIAADENSPLHQIREKELEISGRVLSAKREADEVIASARKKAAELMATAEAEGGAGAAHSEQAIQAEAELEANRLRETADQEARVFIEQVESRRAEAVRMIIEEVRSV